MSGSLICCRPKFRFCLGGLQKHNRNKLLQVRGCFRFVRRSSSSFARASRNGFGSTPKSLAASDLKRDSDPGSTSLSAALAGLSCGAGDGSIADQLLVGELAPDDAAQGGSETLAVMALQLVETEDLLINGKRGLEAAAQAA